MKTKETFSLLYILNSGKAKANGECPIVLRITINGKSVSLSTQRSVLPDYWEPKTGMVFGKSPKIKAINEHLEALKVKAYRSYSDLLLIHDTITPELLKETLQGRGNSAKSLVVVWEEHNAELKSLIGKETSYTNWQKYASCLKYIREYLTLEYKASDVSLKRIDFKFIRGFELFLKLKKSCSYNTTTKYLQNFKKVLGHSIKNGWLQQNPMASFKLSLKEVERPFLCEAEIKQLINKEFTIKRLEQVKDIFLFSCFTGLAYSDVKKLRQEELVKQPDGTLWIRTYRKKTKISSNIPVLPEALNIINKYNCNQNHNEAVLPVPSNQKLNAYLKEIADLCGINKALTFHIARHTFATTVTMMNGVSIESVSKMLGHKNIRTTQHYAKIVDEKVGIEMQILTRKLKLKNL